MDVRIKKALVAIIASSMASSIFAAAAGLYGGMDFGVSNSHNKNQTIYTGTGSGINQVSGYPEVVSSSPSNNGLALRLFMGYNINRYVGWEFGFDHFAPTKYSSFNYLAVFPPVVDPDPPDDLPNNPNVVSVTKNPGVNVYGVDFDIKGMLPVGDNFNAFGKVGFALLHQTLSGSLQSCAANVLPCSTVTGINTQSNTNALRPQIGFGVAYDFSQSWEGDISATQILGGSGIKNMSFISVGFAYHAVDIYCGQFLC